VAIPVSLSVGDVYTVAPGEKEIFLPFIQR
jgi:hypothetical protein